MSDSYDVKQHKPSYSTKTGLTDTYKYVLLWYIIC